MTDILLGLIGGAIAIGCFVAGKRQGEGKPPLPQILPTPKGKAISLDRSVYLDDPSA